MENIRSVATHPSPTHGYVRRGRNVGYIDLVGDYSSGTWVGAGRKGGPDGWPTSPKIADARCGRGTGWPRARRHARTAVEILLTDVCMYELMKTMCCSCLGLLLSLLQHMTGPEGVGKRLLADRARGADLALPSGGVFWAWFVVFYTGLGLRVESFFSQVVFTGLMLLRSSLCAPIVTLVCDWSGSTLPTK